tara:strand:+ start:21666 stop:23159 length:1494 start_codon:yes stop_codon:yes gene_type:complete
MILKNWIENPGGKMDTYSFDELIFSSSYIGGEFKKFSDKVFPVNNPANSEKWAEVSDDGVEGVEKAIEEAKEAYPEWASLTAKERAEVLEKWNDLILAHKETLAQIMTLESGKPIKESRGEVEYGSSFIKWFAEEGKRTYGDIIPTPSADKRILTIKQPIGVVGAITPWNFPLAMITRKIAPALAAGCTVVVRPSEQTPLTALAIARLSKDAGFPKGVINICMGSDSSGMGKAICESEVVKKISFTGSTRVGQILMSQSSDTLKKMSLELGGNAPFIVFKDADLDKAVEGLIAAKFRNSGQTCVCVNRIFIQDEVFDEFTKKFVKKVRELKIGPGMEEENHIGPLIHEDAVKKAENFVKDALKKGGELLTGGEVETGQFFKPTVISKATEEMNFFREETFSPIAPLFKFSSEEEVIRKANDTEFGLASYFFSKNMNRIWRVSEALEYGMVGVNTGIISNEVAPFGGVKFSGMGREGSKYGISDFMEIKYICLGGMDR